MTDTSISPLRRRMIEDMKIRGFWQAMDRSCHVASRGG